MHVWIRRLGRFALVLESARTVVVLVRISGCEVLFRNVLPLWVSVPSVFTSQHWVSSRQLNAKNEVEL
jgi:hypothetical protein